MWCKAQLRGFKLPLYSLWRSWSWLRHPHHWRRRSPSTGNCTCWRPGPVSASLWDTNHAVTNLTGLLSKQAPLLLYWITIHKKKHMRPSCFRDAGAWRLDPTKTSHQTISGANRNFCGSANCRLQGRKICSSSGCMCQVSLEAALSKAQHNTFDVPPPPRGRWPFHCPSELRTLNNAFGLQSRFYCQTLFSAAFAGQEDWVINASAMCSCSCSSTGGRLYPQFCWTTTGTMVQLFPHGSGEAAIESSASPNGTFKFDPLL